MIDAMIAIGVIWAAFGYLVGKLTTGKEVK
jgi:hypothetical protein